MTPEEVIIHTQAYAAEWLEMTDNPDAMVSGILAEKIVELTNYITYLERRLDHERENKYRVPGYTTRNPSLVSIKKD